MNSLSPPRRRWLALLRAGVLLSGAALLPLTPAFGENSSAKPEFRLQKPVPGKTESAPHPGKISGLKPGLPPRIPAASAAASSRGVDAPRPEPAPAAIDALSEKGSEAAELAGDRGLGEEDLRAGMDAVFLGPERKDRAKPRRPITGSRKELDAIEKAGPLVDEEEIPVLHATLRRTFERLSSAQRELFPADRIAFNRLFVVRKKDRQAFVHHVSEPGLRKSVNLVFVTTGLIEDFFSDAATAGMGPGMTRLAGALAHELAHPLDYVDSESVRKRHGPEGSQAVETRADAEGTLIARLAGYPADAVYQAVLKLSQEDSGDSGMIRAAVGTHPLNDLRQAGLRLMLTLLRYERGEHAERRPEAAYPTMLTELSRLEKSRVDWSFRKPSSLAEALQRLGAASSEQGHKRSGYDNVEANRLVLFIDDYFYKKGRDLSAEERQAFIEFNRLLMEKMGYHLMDRSGMDFAFTRETESLEFLNYPPHRIFMDKIAAYRSPEYLSWAKADLLARSELPQKPAGLFKLLGDAKDILPDDLLFQLFEKEIEQSLPAAMRDQGRIRPYEGIHGLSGWAPLEQKLRLARIFHEKVLPALSEEDKAALLAHERSSSDYSFSFPKFKSEEERNKAMLALNRLMADPREKELAELYRGVLRSLWEKRGYYGTLSFLEHGDYNFNFHHMDWEMIFQALGIDRDAGYSQLRQAVKQFTASKAYADLLRTVSESSDSALIKLKKGDELGGLEAPWADESLAPYLSGERNPELRGQEGLRAVARAAFSAPYLAARPGLLRRLFKARLERFLGARAAAGVSLEELAGFHRETLAELLGPGPRVHQHIYVLDLYARAIDRAPIAEENKRNLLKAVLFDFYKEAVPGLLTAENKAGKRPWLERLDEEQSHKALRKILLKHRVIESTLDLFPDAYQREVSDWDSGYRASLVSRFSDELIEELERRLEKASGDKTRLKVLRAFAEKAIGRGDARKLRRAQANTRPLRAFKARLLQGLDPLRIPLEEKLRFHELLTVSGPTPATDEYFERHLRDYFSQPFDAPSHKGLAALLESRGLDSSARRLELARRLLEPEIQKLERGAVGLEDLNSLVDRLNLYAPVDSLKKDLFLEELAWRLKIEGAELLAFIEDHKSHNWRKVNPIWVRLGSAVSHELAGLKAAARLEFIDYLLHSEGRELPPVLWKAVEKSARREVSRYIHATLDFASRESAAEVAHRTKLELEAAVREATPLERIPLVEFLIRGGRAPLSSELDFPVNVTRRFLGHRAGSSEEKTLLAFLAAIPEHERSVSLAYLLSQAGQDKSSVKDTFEVFQAVGIKAGQLSSVWKIFGPEIAEETRELKDGARPLSKAQILEIMGRELTTEERSRILRLVRVLGSASMKTVVEVELTDGRRAVMMVQRPHAREQIEGNLGRAGRFLQELRRQGVSLPALLDTILGAVRGVLGEELLMTGEARRIGEAKALYEKFNGSMKSTLGAWRFAVPNLEPGFKVRDSVLFLEKAEGVPFDKLPESVQREVGPALVESSLKALFREGWFDPDRHARNQLIDPVGKIIHPLDFGQAQAFSKTRAWEADDRYLAAGFLEAVDSNDPGRVLAFGLAMSRTKPSVEGMEGLKPALRRGLSEGKDLPERLTAIVNAFAENGAVLHDRFAFGVLKGLMLLAGENYVPEPVFRGLMEREVRRLLQSKAPRYLWDRYGPGA